MKRRITAVLALAGCAALAAMADPGSAQQKPATGPVARYDIRAGTISGVGAMGRGAGAAMGMMFGGGGGNNVQRELYLRIGSSQPTKAMPRADHFMPPATRLGKSVPLITPSTEKGPVDELPGERPKGRMLIYWGCGEHAPKGQPVIIDFAKLAQGQVPPGLWSGMVLRDWGPTLANSKTFARWPNEDTVGGNKAIKSDASLIGPHRVASTYAPEMNFTLTKDFMAPLKVSTSSTPGGGGLLRWNAVADATGYYASLFGGKDMGGKGGDMVMWSSSASRQFGGGLNDWISPAQAASLVAGKILLAPSTTSCIVPAEVRAATDVRFGMLTAFGPEEIFAYPPRPAAGPWNLQWTARVRHRSMTSWMDMPGMGAGMMGEGGQGDNPKCKPKKGLGGIMGGVLGGGPGC